MNRKQTENILQFYKNIQCEIKVQKELLCEINTLYDTRKSNEYNFTKTSKVANVVETRMIEIDEKKESVKKIEERIEKMKKIGAEILSEISELEYIQKQVIYKFYIKGEKWNQIAREINYSVRQSKNIRDKALSILSIQFEKNRNIKNSNLWKES